jgi:SAM-dependent methyltransferase
MDVVERLTLAEARAPTLLALTHVHRYQLAAKLCAGLRVLDLCCGSGYGTRILAKAADHVHGVDVDEPSVKAAEADAASLPNATFERADALEVLERPLARSYDAIVLLEGLEHLPDLERAVESLRAQVGAGIVLVVSLPNSRTFGEENPHHVTEFDYEQASSTFERLGIDEVLLQFHAEGSLIGSLTDESVEASLAWPERCEPEHCNHLIGLANLREERRPGLASSRVQVAVAPTFNTYMLQLEKANRELRRANLRMSRDRIGVADSAAAATVEQLRRAEEAEPPRPPPRGPLTRLWSAAKRVVAMIVPHGLIVLQQRLKERLASDEESEGEEAEEIPRRPE